jgi:hypothetical protein
VLNLVNAVNAACVNQHVKSTCMCVHTTKSCVGETQVKVAIDSFDATADFDVCKQTE